MNIKSEMIRLLAGVVTVVLLSTYVAFAEVNVAENDGESISVSGKTAKGIAGERYSLILHQDYNSENPIASAIGVWQGISGANGEWSLNIPLAESAASGNLSLQYGDSSEVSQIFEISEYTEEVTFSIDDVGHIFFEPQNVKLQAEIDNKTQNNHKYDIYVRVYEEGKSELLAEQTYSVTALKNEKKKYQISVDMTKAELSYGMFELSAAAVEAGSAPEDENYSERIRFSVAKKSEAQNNKLGIHTQFGHGYADPSVNTMLLKNAGFAGIRDYVARSQCFPDGVWQEPVRYNAWVDDIKNNNLSQIIQLGSSDMGFPTTEDAIKDFTNYAVAAAENLTEDGVFYYELWNEPNWTISAEDYANLLISVAPAIKDVDENVKLLVFAAAGVSNFHTANWVIDVINVIKQKNLDPHNYIDYISVHPYKPLNQWAEKSERTHTCTYGTESYREGESSVDTNDTIPGDSSLTARLDNLVNRLKGVGCDDIPLIATEMGWYSLEGASKQTNCETCLANEVTSLSEIGQAQYSVRASALLYNKLEQMYFHTLNNKPSTAVDWEINFGFTENWSEAEIPYEAKPVYIAMANFNAMLGNAELTEENVSGNVYDYVFLKNGQRIHMMWTTDETGTKGLSLEDKAICVYDMYGNASEKQYSSEGVYNITLSQSPVYVEEISELAELNIVNKTGESLSKIGDNTEFSASMSVLTEAAKEGLLMCAAYRDNVLISAETQTVSAGACEESTPYIKAENADEVRVFYWSLEDLIPYCGSKTIGK